MATSTRLEWHYTIHERFGETLYYFFLAFHPTYERTHVFKALQELLSNHNIQGHAYHEVFGPVDLVLRVWLPASKASIFYEALRHTFPDRGLTLLSIERFQAEENLHHWLWPDGLIGIDPRETNMLNSDLLKTASVADIEEAQKQNPPSTKYQDLLKTVTEEPGIRFFMTIPPPQRRLSLRIIERFMDDTVILLKGDDKLKQVAAYYGTGPLISILIEGLVSFEHYTSISILNSRINERGLDSFETKTTTFLGIATEGGHHTGDVDFSFTEIKGARELRDATYYLNADEGEELEFKGSLEIDIKRFLATGEVSRHKNGAVLDEVLGTIVAYLNTAGGELVVGAVEDNKFQGVMRKRLEEYPLIGKMRVCGIKWEYGERGWDSFDLHLTNFYRDRIGTDKTAGYVKTRRVSFEGEDLCVIQVQPLPLGESAYLDEEHFFVRQGGNTIELKGQRLESYLRTRQRGRDTR